MSNRISFVEIEIKKCQLVYGSTPCTAAVGVTGERKCFNSRATCQDLTNISESNETIRLATPSSITPQGIGSDAYIPNVASINYTPPTLDLGRSIGVRASLSVSFADHRSPDTDVSGDPYLSDRNYDPYTLGTYFGKLKARHPFLRGQSIYWVQGRDDQDIATMERRHFVIESTTGPTSSGVYSITAKDALKLAQGDRALAPAASQGYLSVAITDVETSIVLSPAGIGNIEYPASGLAAIGGKEIVSFTRSADVLTIVRAQKNTEASTHEAEDRVQLCLVYSAQKPSSIFEDLLTNYASMPAGYIPSADWLSEADTFLNRAYSAVIAEPTPVNTLINELIEQTGSTMWWDNEASLVRWEVLKNPDSSAFEFNESNYIKGSFNIADQFDKRVSRVIVRYGQINPLLNLTDARNYSASLLNIEPDSELYFDGAPSYRSVFSRWILGDSRDTASTLAELITQRYAIPPRKLGFKLMRDTLEVMPGLAGSYQFRSLYVQDDTGDSVAIPIQVTSINPSAAMISVSAEEITFSTIIPRDPNTVNLTPTNGYLNYNIYDRTVLELGAAPTAATVVNVFISEGYVLGSESTGLYSMTTGSGWPVGATINIYNRGTIAGRGGNGGNGSSLNVKIDDLPVRFLLSEITSATVGGVGGPAFEAQYPVNLYNYGIIGGGGGGGGGSGAAAAVAKYYKINPGIGDTVVALARGPGGGGGAGYPAGNGGDSPAFTYAIDSDFNEVRSEINVATGGNAGSLLTGGKNGTNGYGDAAGSYFRNDVTATALTPAGIFTQFANPLMGDGGSMGDPGNTCVYTASSGVLFETPAQPDGGGVISNTIGTTGAAAGAAGAAIVENGGTITYLITGDIRGAIL